MNLSGKTDIGLKRQINQDTFFIHQFSDDIALAIVCDGMGGQNAGNIASELACQTISNYLLQQDYSQLNKKKIKQILISAISEGNILVYEKSLENQEYYGMGTTVVIALIIENNAYIAHIGDSRAYLLKNDKLIQITKDHSLVQELVDKGKITKEEMISHPNKNMITRALGVNLTVDVDYIELSLSERNKIMLCTDGLTNMCSDELINKILSKRTAVDSCEELIKSANKAGGIDNITVAIIE